MVAWCNTRHCVVRLTILLSLRALFSLIIYSCGNALALAVRKCGSSVGEVG